jgi:hypothetical protein
MTKARSQRAELTIRNGDGGIQGPLMFGRPYKGRGAAVATFSVFVPWRLSIRVNSCNSCQSLVPQAVHSRFPKAIKGYSSSLNSIKGVSGKNIFWTTPHHARPQLHYRLCQVIFKFFYALLLSPPAFNVYCVPHGPTHSGLFRPIGTYSGPPPPHPMAGTRPFKAF